MKGPGEEERTYYVYGFWHIDDGKQYVTKDGKINIQEFSDIDNAMSYMKRQVLSNVNITWCITWDGYEIEKICDNSECSLEHQQLADCGLERK